VGGVSNGSTPVHGRPKNHQCTNIKTAKHGLIIAMVTRLWTLVPLINLSGNGQSSSNCDEGKYIKHISFPWPPLEASLLKTIFEKELIKT
jgi:hypothetical protein